MNKLTVILPCLNEAENLPKLIKEIESFIPDCRIIVVDDSSSDGTGEAVSKLINQNIIVLERTQRGLRTSIFDALGYVKTSYVAVMDSDLSHPPKALAEMFQDAKSSKDLVIGSRYVDGGKSYVSLKRHMGSWLINWFARLILGIPLKDVTGGFLCGPTKILKKIFPYLKASYGDYCIELLFYAKSMNVNFVELPFTYRWREWGETKSGTSWKYIGVGLEYGWTVLRLLWNGSHQINGDKTEFLPPVIMESTKQPPDWMREPWAHKLSCLWNAQRSLWTIQLKGKLAKAREIHRSRSDIEDIYNVVTN